MRGKRQQDPATRAGHFHNMAAVGDRSHPQRRVGSVIHIFFFCICMFYQVLGVPQSSSSTQTWGSVLPSIVETRDQNFRGCPLLFSNRNLGSFCAYGTEILYTHSLWEVVDHSRSKMHETCLIIIDDPGMRPCPESNQGPLD